MAFAPPKTLRRRAVQGGFLAVLTVLILSALLTARANLQAQGMDQGFDFLAKSTGWEMNFTLLPATTSDSYGWYLVLGLLNTLFMGTIGLVGASVLGLGLGLMRSGRNPAARLLATLYIEIFRNLPLILQLFFWYALANGLPAPRQSIELAGGLINARGIYLPGLTIAPGSLALACLALGLALCFRRPAVIGLGLAGAALALVLGHAPGTPWVSYPSLQGLKIAGGLRLQPEVYTLALAIITYGAAYVAEIVRGGFKAVGRGQTEAAAALGLSPWQVFSRIRLPLAFRAMLPILINQYVWLIKATTLGIAVGFSDFFMVIASSINHSGQTFQLIGLLMAGFLLINFSLSAVLNRLNRAIAIKGHQTTGVA